MIYSIFIYEKLQDYLIYIKYHLIIPHLFKLKKNILKITLDSK